MNLYPRERELKITLFILLFAWGGRGGAGDFNGGGGLIERGEA